MSDIDDRCLAEFPQWLASLATDVCAVAQVAGQQAQPESARWLFAAVNHVVRSLDLIPPSALDLGLLEGAIVLRHCVELATQEQPELLRGAEELVFVRLLTGASLAREFLGEGAADQLGRYVAGLYDVRAHGRSVGELLESEELRSALLTEASSWAEGYAAPEFGAGARTLIALRSFLQVKFSA